MMVPEPGSNIVVKSLANSADNTFDIGEVKLLGYDGKLVWSRKDDGLSITMPSDLSDFKTSLVFRIEKI